jgi:hypothetical protein
MQRQGTRALLLCRYSVASALIVKFQCPLRWCSLLLLLLLLLSPPGAGNFTDILLCLAPNSSSCSSSSSSKWHSLAVPGSGPGPRGWFASTRTPDGSMVVHGGLGTDNGRMGDMFMLCMHA